MNFDFPTFLVIACALTGGIWLLDTLWLASRRRQRATEVGGAPGQAHLKEPVLVEYARSFFPVILVVLLLRSFLVEPFRIPSGSMMPTLLVGDFILVNKFAYGLRWPVLNTKFLDLGEPQRGDVAVFRFPLEPGTDYIKRIVGVPGDEIFYRNKTLFVNGKPMPQTPDGTFTGVGAGANMTGARIADEQLGDVEHRILIHPRAPDLAPGCYELLKGPIKIPEGHYFAMGDNRDNSNDSRCWGLVPEGNLVGKAFAIWMNWDGQRDGFPLDWSRLGTLIK
jgi:signal peptidase I